MFSLASSSSSDQPKLTFSHDVFLIFNGLEEGVRTFLQNSLRDAGITTFIGDLAKDSVWDMKERCRIVVVLITPQLFVSDICLERVMSMMLEPAKTVLPFFYGVNQDEVRLQFERFNFGTYVEDMGGHSELESLHRRADAVYNSLYGFTLSPDLGIPSAAQTDGGSEGSFMPVTPCGQLLQCPVSSPAVPLSLV